MAFEKYVTLRGRHGAGDIWQCGFYGQHDGDDTALAHKVADAAATLLFSGTGCPFPTAVTFANASVAKLEVATGHLAPAVSWAHTQAGAIASSLPPECAICVTMTDVDGHKGRFYLPPLGANQVDVNGFINGDAHAWLADHLDSFWQGLASDTDTFRSVVYSPKRRAAVATSTFSIGSVVDSQRRRRNKVAESRLTRNMPI